MLHDDTQRSLRRCNPVSLYKTAVGARDLSAGRDGAPSTSRAWHPPGAVWAGAGSGGAAGTPPPGGGDGVCDWAPWGGRSPPLSPRTSSNARRAMRSSWCISWSICAAGLCRTSCGRGVKRTQMCGIGGVPRLADATPSAPLPSHVGLPLAENPLPYAGLATDLATEYDYGPRLEEQVRRTCCAGNRRSATGSW